MEKVLNELGKNFDLSGKELIIIEALTDKKQNAAQLSKTTDIPLGRIYEYLNHLITIRIIEKSEKKPFIYFIENLDQNISEFLKFNFEQTVQKQNRIFKYLCR